MPGRSSTRDPITYFFVVIRRWFALISYLLKTWAKVSELMAATQVPAGGAVLHEPKNKAKLYRQPVESITECLQVTFNAGDKRVAIPMSSAKDIPSIPTTLITKFQISF